MSRVVKNFESRQCMSRVVTNRVRQNLVLQSLSDDLKKKARVGNPRIRREKKNSQGRNPRIRKKKRAVPTAGKRAVPTAGKEVNL